MVIQTNATINMEMKSKMMTTQYPENKNIKKKINGWILNNFTFAQWFLLMLILQNESNIAHCYRCAAKSLARPTSQCISFDGENISFDASLVIYKNSTNIPPIMIINRIYESQNPLLLYLVSFLVGLRTYQHPCTRHENTKTWSLDWYSHTIINPSCFTLEGIWQSNFPLQVHYWKPYANSSQISHHITNIHSILFA